VFANLADFLPKVTVHQRRKPFWLDSILNEISVKALIPEVISIKGQLTQLSLVTLIISWLRNFVEDFTLLNEFSASLPRARHITPITKVESIFKHQLRRIKCLNSLTCQGNFRSICERDEFSLCHFEDC